MSNENAERANRIPLVMFNKGDLAVGDQVFAADYIEHVQRPPGVPSGLAGVKYVAQAVRGAFPDFRYVVNRTVSEGDFVVQHLTASGTMQGEFLGMTPSGKPAAWDEVHISRFGGGKIVEHWAVRDELGMLRQLGFAPSPGAPPR